MGRLQAKDFPFRNQKMALLNTIPCLNGELLMTTELQKRMLEDMQLRNLSPHTQASYLLQASLFARYFNNSPEILPSENIS
jgi:hypothetical protein